MALLVSEQALVTFQDVAVYFSVAEWQCLEEWQKELYRTVMEEIHTALLSLGYAILNPDTLFRIKKESEAFRLNRCDSESKGVNACLTTDPEKLAPDILFRIKVDEESVVVDSEDGDSNSSLCEPVISQDCLRQVKKEDDLQSSDGENIRPEAFTTHLITRGQDNDSEHFVLIKSEEESSPIENYATDKNSRVQEPLIIYDRRSEDIIGRDGVKNPKQHHVHGTSTGDASQFLEDYKRIQRNNGLMSQKGNLHPSRRKLTVAGAMEEWHNGEERYIPHKQESHTVDETCVRYTSAHNDQKLELGSPGRERTFVPGPSLSSRRNHTGFQHDKWVENKHSLCVESPLEMNRRTQRGLFSYHYRERETSSRNPVEEIHSGDTSRAERWSNSLNHNRGGVSHLQGYHEDPAEGESGSIRLPSALRLHQKRLSRDAAYRRTQHENRSLNNGLCLEQHRLTDRRGIPYAPNECRDGLNFSISSALHQQYYTVESQCKFTDRTRNISRMSAFALNHIKQNGGRLYECTECDKSFFQKGQLMNHRKIHRGGQTHQCAVCGKRFPRLMALAIHRRIHTGVRPYKCTMCEKSFSQRSHVVRHQKIHTGERPYRCTECGKGFSQRSDLVIHFRTHTGEKPYPCNTCGRCFSVRSNLVKHERCHTQGKLLAVCI